MSQYDHYLRGFQQASIQTERLSATLNAGQAFVLSVGERPGQRRCCGRGGLLTPVKQATAWQAADSRHLRCCTTQAACDHAHPPPAAPELRFPLPPHSARPPGLTLVLISAVVGPGSNAAAVAAGVAGAASAAAASPPPSFSPGDLVLLQGLLLQLWSPLNFLGWLWRCARPASRPGTVLRRPLRRAASASNTIRMLHSSRPTAQAPSSPSSTQIHQP